MADPILNAAEVAARQGWSVVGVYVRAATPRWGSSVPIAICLMQRLESTATQHEGGDYRIAEIRCDAREFAEGWYSADRIAAYERWEERVNRAHADIAIYLGLS